MFEEPHYGIPYEGAKPYLLIEDLEDPSFLKRLVQATYEALPVKVKKASTSKQREKQEVKEKKPTLGS